MTVARHPRKLTMVLAPCLLTATVLAIAGMLAAARAQSEPAPPVAYIVVDRHSGLAIDGFDPVAYFTDGTAVLGREAYELRLANVVWRFRNEGNRAVFKAHPEVYMPRFGGYDPVAIARGVGVAGNPHYWLVKDEHLYLFYDESARAAFLADSDGALATTTDRMWPKVQLTLAP